MISRRALIPSIAAVAAAAQLPWPTGETGEYGSAAFTSRWVMDFEEVRYWLRSSTLKSAVIPGTGSVLQWYSREWVTPAGPIWTILFVGQPIAIEDEHWFVKWQAETIATNQIRFMGLPIA